MRLSFFNDLYNAFPRSIILFTTLGAEVFDSRGEMIGYIPNDNLFVLCKEYTHRDQALSALKDAGVRYTERSHIQALYSTDRGKKKSRDSS